MKLLPSSKHFSEVFSVISMSFRISANLRIFVLIENVHNNFLVLHAGIIAFEFDAA